MGRGMGLVCQSKLKKPWAGVTWAATSYRQKGSLGERLKGEENLNGDNLKQIAP